MKRFRDRTGSIPDFLIAGFTDAMKSLRERGFHYQSMTAIGYRRWVRLHSPLKPEITRDATTITYPQNLSLKTLAAALR